MIYLDNSATSYPKPLAVRCCVINSISRCGGNPGRSGHDMSVKAAEMVYEAREVVARHLNFDYPERVVFTENATYALNLAIKGLITGPCHVIISNLEHNSVIRPVVSLNKTFGVEYSVFDARKPLRDEILKVIREDTRFIICSAVSNVTGVEVDLQLLSSIADEYGIGLILDLSQYLGHKKFDSKRVHFSALCAPGHKGLLGITGCGFAVFNKDVSPFPLIDGGSGYNSISGSMPDDLPERLEAGTLPVHSIASLKKGIEYIDSYGISCIENKLSYLCEYTRHKLEELDFVEIYGINNGIVAFNVIGEPSTSVAQTLNENGICVRGGLHCAPLAHTAYGTLERGMVRVSFSLFNKTSDVNRLQHALWLEYKNSRR